MPALLAQIGPDRDGEDRCAPTHRPHQRSHVQWQRAITSMTAPRPTARQLQTALVLGASALQAGGGSDSLEVSVPAGIARLFKHPVLDWGLNSVGQTALQSREVSGQAARIPCQLSVGSELIPRSTE